MATPESCDDKDLECPVCMEPYALVGDHQPRVLACSGAHELCEQCIAASPRVSSKLVCPQCREHVATSNPNRGLIAALRMHAGSRAREATAAGAAAVAEAAAAANLAKGKDREAVRAAKRTLKKYCTAPVDLLSTYEALKSFEAMCASVAEAEGVAGLKRLLAAMQKADSCHALPSKHWEYSEKSGTDLLQAKLSEFKNVGG